MSLAVFRSVVPVLALFAGCDVGLTERPLAGVAELALFRAALLVPFVINVNSARSPPDPYVSCAGR